MLNCMMYKKVTASKLAELTNTAVAEEYEGRIIELSDDHSRGVSIGDPYYLPSEGWYRINKIEKKDGTIYLSMFERSDTSLFILPLINDNRMWWTTDMHLVNAFDRIEGKIPSDAIYVVYREPLTDEKETSFNKRDSSFRQSAYFKDVLPMPKGFVCYRFAVPSSMLNDLQAFRNSKFSKMSDRAKSAIITFNNGTKFIERLKRQLNRDDSLRKQMEEQYNVSIPRDAELRSLINESRETLDIRQFEFEK